MIPAACADTSPSVQKPNKFILYCYSPTCHLAAKAAVQFAAQGYPVMEMDSGFEVWRQKQLNVEK
jgi:rhodanese-related sulfurtransferase